MKIILSFIFTMTTIQVLLAQQPYFQQEVNYKINALLIDSTHILIGRMELEYINHSPDALSEIYFHLWANAFQDKTTAFAKQQLQRGETDFYFASKTDLGGYKNLIFQQNGQTLSIVFDEMYQDIARVKLAQPLESGKSTNFVIDFTLKIPTSYSRLGHVGASYQMTQWYPKPAVYDHKGWHPLPYLDLGEFYSEFGNFEVDITLPENYVVAATGVLETESEKVFLKQKEEETQRYFRGEKDLFPNDKTFPVSSKKLKTIRYTTQNVHDFAWFADKRFRVAQQEVALKSGKKITTWAMFTATEENLWREAVQYIGKAIQFYSEKVSEYPYPQATAVQSALSAGAGMEYPMITVIGEAGRDILLDEVITHEVGHNWFYGILASNERDHAWMDEGMNSYYEARYMNENYPNLQGLNTFLPEFLIGDSKMGLNELSYLLQARRQLDQAPETTSSELTTLNYQISAYSKPALAFRHLEYYLGEASFDELMQAYYQEWQFKHPYPEDFQMFVENKLGKKLPWFFDGLIASKQKLDYAISAVTTNADGYQITIKNKAAIAAPFPIAAFKAGELIREIWFEGIEETGYVTFPSGDYDELVLDAQRATPELDRIDNNFHLKGAFKKRDPYLINLIGKLENDQQRALAIAPALGWNNYDRFMIGLTLHNKSIPFRNVEFALLPMFAFGTERLTGLGTVRYHIYPTTDAIERISLQLNGKTFSYSSQEIPNFENHFSKFAPTLELKLGKRLPTSTRQQRFQWRSVLIQQNSGKAIDSVTVVRTKNNYAIHELSYQWEDKNKLNPFLLQAHLQGGEGFSKLFTSYQQRLSGSKPNKYLDIRLFGDIFLNYDRQKVNQSGINPQFLLSGTTGSTAERDYVYDEMLLGRTENDGLLSHQVFLRDAGFKTLTSVGRSSDWMTGLNLRTTLPGKLPFGLFADGALSRISSRTNTSTGTLLEEKATFYYSAGVVVPVAKDIFEIYLPLLESTSIQDNHEVNDRNTLLNRITFRIQLAKINPFQVLDEFSL